MYTWVSVCRYVFVCVMSMSVWLLRQEAPIDIEQVAHCGHFLAVFCLFFVCFVPGSSKECRKSKIRDLKMLQCRNAVDCALGSPISSHVREHKMIK